MHGVGKVGKVQLILYLETLLKIEGLKDSLFPHRGFGLGR